MEKIPFVLNSNDLSLEQIHCILIFLVCQIKNGDSSCKVKIGKSKREENWKFRLIPGTKFLLNFIIYKSD
jgi:hypothetical protein